MGYFKDKYSKKVNKYDFKCENPVYTDLKTLFNKNGAEKVYKVRALFLAEKGKFAHPVAALDINTFADLPPHLMDQIKEMRADSVATDLINKGLVGLTIYEYDSDKRKDKCYSVDFVDLDNTEDPDDDMPFPVE